MSELNQLKLKKNYLIMKKELKDLQVILSTEYNNVAPYSETLSKNIWNCFRKINHISDLLEECFNERI